MASADVNRFRRGQLLRIHLTDRSSVEGVLKRRGRRYFTLSLAKVEESGGWHELASERLHVPHDKVLMVEVVL